MNTREKKPRNPPAFPVVTKAGIVIPGMTLRDWFAGQIAPVIWKQFNEDDTCRKFPEWKYGVAVEAYHIADAMLQERLKGEKDE